MELEGLLLLTCKCHRKKDKELACVTRRIPMKDYCYEEMISNFKKKLPKSYRYQGIMSARVVMTDGNEEIYFASPIKINRWKVIVDTMAYCCYKRCEDFTEEMEKENAIKSADEIMKMYGWEDSSFSSFCFS